MPPAEPAQSDDQSQGDHYQQPDLAGLGLLVVLQQVIQIAGRRLRRSAEVEDATGVGGGGRRRLLRARRGQIVVIGGNFCGGFGHALAAHSAEAVIIRVFVSAIRTAQCEPRSRALEKPTGEDARRSTDSLKLNSRLRYRGQHRAGQWFAGCQQLYSVLANVLF